MLFDGSSSSDVDHFLFYFENIAEVGSVGKEKARAVVTDFPGDAFKIFLKRLTKQGQLREEAEYYDTIKELLREKYGKKCNTSNAIECDVSLQMQTNETLLQFIKRP